ncbi:UNVERIFIED_CONTAM: hypothetical protein Slati_3696700 [Sesamum latifolium]|uniref:Reverse transcriptase Ty1/copia-type domain-containing protein n=1 Tax=Sesamum latifolium TaxID=2727402 RepID=A0AAW2U181_9LAMI
MDSRRGFTTVGEEQKVYRLQRSIYGLKQASRSWNTHFDEVIRGYISSRTSMILVYTRRSVEAQLRTLCLCRDILLIRKMLRCWATLKHGCPLIFHEDMGEASLILGIKTRDRSRRMLGLTSPRTLRSLEEIQDKELKTRIPSHEAWD